MLRDKSLNKSNLFTWETERDKGGGGAGVLILKTASRIMLGFIFL